MQDGAEQHRTVVLDGSAVTSVVRAELGRLTGQWHSLLTAHQADDRGKCLECSGWVLRRRWPCQIWLTAHQLLLAERARRRSEQRRRRAICGPRNPTVVVPRQAPPIAVAQPAEPGPVAAEPPAPVAGGPVAGGPAAEQPAVDEQPDVEHLPLRIHPVIHRAAVVERAAG